MPGFGESINGENKSKNKKKKSYQIDGSDLEYIAKTEGRDSAAYQTAVRAAVEQIVPELSPLHKVTATEEVFEDSNGDRRSVEDIAKVLGGRQIAITQDGTRIADGGFKNASPFARNGKYVADISVNLSEIEAGASPMRALNVNDWASDPVARAFLLPEEVDFDNASSEEKRAAVMGAAASQGDREAVMAAQKRYKFSDEEVNQFMSMTKIGKTGTASAVRKSGLDEGRAKEVLHPITKELVAGSPQEKSFYEERSHQLWKDWLEGGGTGFNDAKNAIAIPGNNYQMEHDSAFSTTNADALAETPLNRAGFLERLVNSEKSDIDPTTYYQIQRLHLLAHDQGLTLNGVLKADGSEATLRGILERDNPSVTQTSERLIKDRSDIHHPERAELNEKLLQRALTPAQIRARQTTASTPVGLMKGLNILSKLFS